MADTPTVSAVKGTAIFTSTEKRNEATASNGNTPKTLETDTVEFCLAEDEPQSGPSKDKIQTGIERAIKEAKEKPENVRRAWLEACDENILKAQDRVFQATGTNLEIAKKKVTYWTGFATGIQVSLGIVKEGEVYKRPQAHLDKYKAWFEATSDQLLKSHNRLFDTIITGQSRSQEVREKVVAHWNRTMALSQEYHGGQLKLKADIQKEFQELRKKVDDKITDKDTAKNIHRKLITYRAELLEVMTSLNIPQQKP